jgi:glycosyltransferase involved in cell wall biosynthesis
LYLSIITITYNNVKGLKKTAKSILPLPENVEWIIIDGNSSDKTLSFLKKLRVQDRVSFLSEFDKGIYDAMNKGILLSKGKYLNFMNSGDLYIRESFVNLTSAMRNDADIFMYDCQTIAIDGGKGYARRFPDSIDEIKKWACVQHQSTLISKKVFDKLGLYSMEYKYLSDYEHSVRAYLDKDILFNLNPNVKLSLFLLDGVSTNSKTALTIANEYKDIQLKYFGKYNHKLFVTNHMKYIIGKIPIGNFIIFFLKKIFLKKR